MPVLPKVLIIGQPFTNNSGGGITQANLFHGWDKDKIAVLCTVHMFKNLNPRICDTYYLLGSAEYKWYFPFNLIQRKTVSGEVKVAATAETIQKNKPGTVKISGREKFITKYFYPFLEYTGLIHRVSKLDVSEQLVQWIAAYNPDVIYAQASTRETVLFCSKVADKIKKPMVFHMMDDWPSTISEKGPFKNYWKRKIDGEFRQMLGKCSVLLSISGYMADEYKRRYGKSFTTFHNPIDIEFWKSSQRNKYNIAGKAELLYAGRIGPGIQDSLETIAAATDLVNQQHGLNVEFVLQTESKPSWVDNYKSARYRTPVAYEALPKVFAEADMLILPYDFSADSIKFIGFSMPTKAPEYMASGTPVIVFAPDVTAIVKDAEKNRWGKVVTENNIEKLALAISELCSNEAERRDMAQRAVEMAETKFNSVRVRNEFREVLSAAKSN
ncbi:MAG: glycosyltransferase [Ferruginibacter sp.]